MPDTDAAETPDDASPDPSVADRARNVLSENGTGMVQDLLFAFAWVGLVSLLYDFAFSAAPQWVLYMFMLAGIPAYFGFFISLEIARERGAR
ncbi:MULTISPECIES: hypothetical protein [Halorubrum]|uniref:DUF8119 domain-containing protein n=1 Tax=Halorubrum sodomense TaxID=35743 RepID=A0A1I6H2Z1_HALSD|nr:MULTISPECIES: hypothetical protein [Halorubrum]TKX54949.1 hypothetical protein EXE42_05465 [Halorubrum sp. SP3]TKX71583.1 hypothetical protein EXE45_01605 [Halorubrum sp. SP9]SFR48772.1 hypothetical protein SAMN04487937_2377 [Halorubrum sodomense]